MTVGGSPSVDDQRHALAPPTRFSPLASAASIFGLLEHLRETRFTVPQITSLVTPPFSKRLENQAESRAPSSKNARIHVAWVKFQKSLSRVGVPIRTRWWSVQPMSPPISARSATAG
jgi:hypothetical protein